MSTSTNNSDRKLFRHALANCSAALLLAASASAMSIEAGQWSVRAGLTNVNPDASSDPLALNGSRSAFVDAVGPETLDVDDSTQLGLTVEYHVTADWGIELLAASPFDHSAEGTKTFNGVELVDTKQLPPTLSAIYHFNNGSPVTPYVGLGLNYTVFFEEDTTGAADGAFAGLGLTGADVSVDSSWGTSVQAGFDVDINDNIMVNFSARWIDIDTEVDITFDGGTKITTDLEIDPMVYSLLLGYRL